MAFTYTFGSFEMRPAGRRLRRSGADVALTARAFDVLAALVERGGELVSRDELLARVWRGVVVEDNNLAVQVATLRRLLGPDAIATLPGFGYRFALEVTRAADTGAGTARDALPVERGNLPVRLPPLVGRDDDARALAALVGHEPLVTLCGGPGLGKTRLAQAVAHAAQDRFPDGVFWVDLVPVPAEDDANAGAVERAIVDAVARALGLDRLDDADPLGAVVQRLRNATLLVVLDNAEHVVMAAARVASELVGRTARVAVLATSQRPLQLGVERVLRLDPLSVPPADADDATLREAGAVRLLAARAAQAGSALDDAPATWRLAAAACRALDGNALAIELAAARLPALGLEGLVARLGQRLSLLAPVPPVPASRGNALALALDWSHGLLEPAMQRAFRRLGAFPGAFTPEQAAALLREAAVATHDDTPAADATTVLALAERSLVATEGPARHRLLETGRLYAHARLAEAGEADAVRAAFRRVVLAHLEAAESAWWTMARAPWRAAWEPMRDSAVAAIDDALHVDPAQAVALFAASWPLWVAGAMQREGRALGERLVPVASGLPQDRAAARFWYALARVNRSEYPARCRDAAERAAAAFRSVGDAAGECLSLAEYAFNWRVRHALADEAMARAVALEDAAWPPMMRVPLHNSVALGCMLAGDHAGARAGFERCLALSEAAGSPEGVETAQINLADLARVEGRLDEAIARGEALRLHQLAQGSAATLVAMVLCNLLGALAAAGHFARAGELARECLQRAGRRAIDTCMWCSLDACAWLHARAGGIETAARLLGASDRAYRDHGQSARQPNEAEDRAEAQALVDAALDAATRGRLHAEGEAWSAEEAVVVGFDVPT